MSAQFEVIGIYDCELAFGGREEGGWWYTVGSLVPNTPTVRVLKLRGRHNHVRAAFDRMHTVCDAMNAAEGRIKKSSTISDGEFEPHIFDTADDRPPEGFPCGRPHYE